MIWYIKYKIDIKKNKMKCHYFSLNKFKGITIYKKSILIYTKYFVDFGLSNR
jgi:hypothetical protein